MNEPQSLEEMKARYKETRARLFGAGRSLPPQKVEAEAEEPQLEAFSPPPMAILQYEVPAEILALVQGDHRSDEIARAIIAVDYARRNRLRAPERVKKLAREIGRQHGVPWYLVLGRTQIKKARAARRDLMAALVAQGVSYSAAGRYLNRNHSTVHFAVNGKKGRS